MDREESRNSKKRIQKYKTEVNDKLKLKMDDDSPLSSEEEGVASEALASEAMSQKLREKKETEQTDYIEFLDGQISSRTFDLLPYGDLNEKKVLSNKAYVQESMGIDKSYILGAIVDPEYMLIYRTLTSTTLEEAKSNLIELSSRRDKLTQPVRKALDIMESCIEERNIPTLQDMIGLGDESVGKIIEEISDDDYTTSAETRASLGPAIDSISLESGKAKLLNDINNAADNDIALIGLFDKGHSFIQQALTRVSKHSNLLGEYCMVKKDDDKGKPVILFGNEELSKTLRVKTGNVVMVGAPTGGAKSMILVNEAVQQFRQGKRALLYGLEGDNDELVSRILSALSMVSEAKIELNEYDLSDSKDMADFLAVQFAYTEQWEGGLEVYDSYFRDFGVMGKEAYEKIQLEYIASLSKLEPVPYAMIVYVSTDDWSLAACESYIAAKLSDKGMKISAILIDYATQLDNLGDGHSNSAEAFSNLLKRLAKNAVRDDYFLMTAYQAKGDGSMKFASNMVNVATYSFFIQKDDIIDNVIWLLCKKGRKIRMNMRVEHTLSENAYIDLPNCIMVDDKGLCYAKHGDYPHEKITIDGLKNLWYALPVQRMENGNMTAEAKKAAKEAKKAEEQETARREESGEDLAY